MEVTKSKHPQHPFHRWPPAPPLYDVTGWATRLDGTAFVSISGNLPNTCYTAKIADKYPGGYVCYVQDPGAAQVFVTVEPRAGSPVSLPVLVPWSESVSIPDGHHATVEIFVNHMRVLTIPIGIPEEEKVLIDKWISAQELDKFGNQNGTMYTGGTPLFDPKTGGTMERYCYIVLHHPDRPWWS